MKKYILIPTIILLLGSMSSCVVNKTLTDQETFDHCYYKKKENQVNKNIKVLFVLTKNSDTILFNKKFPGNITGSGVYGFPEAHILYADVDSSLFNLQSLQSVWRDGIKYEYITQDSTGYICHEEETINIPLDEIEMMKINKVYIQPPIIVAIAAGGATMIIIIVASFFHALASITFQI